jgi:hypothetical protein
LLTESSRNTVTQLFPKESKDQELAVASALVLPVVIPMVLPVMMVVMSEEVAVPEVPEEVMMVMVVEVMAMMAVTVVMEANSSEEPRPPNL